MNSKYKIILIFYLSLFQFRISLNQVYFSPKDNIESVIINKIQKAKKRIYVAVYLITNKNIADAIIRAKRKGLKVEIVTDPVSVKFKYGKIKYMANKNISINIYKNTTIFNKRKSLMHNKFAIIDNEVITGSFNWTKQANNYNKENIVILKDNTITRRYLSEFFKLRKNSKIYNNKNKSYIEKVPSLIFNFLKLIKKYI